MYRILIVDDESHVVDWMYEMLGEIKDVELDLYKATTVTDALCWLGRTRIDIVVTDIAMPGMSGLELHAHIRRLWPACKVIFLTGHNEFDYAYQAVKNEAAGYVLKTEDDDVIIAAVHRAIDSIEESMRQQWMLQQAEDRKQSAIAALRKDYLAELLRGGERDAEQRRQSFKELDIALEADEPVMIVIARIDEENREHSFMKPELIPITAQLIATAALVRWRNCEWLSTLDSVIWFIQGEKEAAEQSMTAVKYVEESLERIQTDCRTKLGISLSLIIAEHPVSWEQVGQKQAGLRQWLMQRMIYGRGLLLTESEREREKKAQPTIGWQPDRSKLEQIRLQLEKGQKEAFEETLTELEQSVAANSFLTGESASSSSYLELFFGISVPLLSYMNRWQLQSLLDMPGIVEKLTQPDLFASWSELFDFHRWVGQEIFRLLGERHEHRESNVIRHVKEYMQANLHTGVTLVELADRVYFNPSYLSRLFKEATGKSVTDYLSELRLERAMSMLQENKKISEISEAVGIESPAYFSRFFKKMTKRSPQEYREAHLLGAAADKTAEGHK